MSVCQGHQVVINDAGKEFLTMLSKTVPENCQILRTQNSALQCSYEQETDNCSNLKVLDNLNYVMTLEDELQC